MSIEIGIIGTSGADKTTIANMLKSVMSEGTAEIVNPLDELGKIADKIPLQVLEDVNRRLGDWLASGGNETDQYVWQQLKYAKRFVK